MNKTLVKQPVLNVGKYASISFGYTKSRSYLKCVLVHHYPSSLPIKDHSIYYSKSMSRSINWQLASPLKHQNHVSPM